MIDSQSTPTRNSLPAAVLYEGVLGKHAAKIHNSERGRHSERNQTTMLKDKLSTYRFIKTKELCDFEIRFHQSDIANVVC